MKNETIDTVKWNREIRRIKMEDLFEKYHTERVRQINLNRELTSAEVSYLNRIKEEYDKAIDNL